jgi:hypothetical protein
MFQPQSLGRLFHQQLVITTETDLHRQVVRFLRQRHPQAILVPGLGEYQVSDELRLDAHSKGYAAGQPDLLVLHPARSAALALEFKNPGYPDPQPSDVQAAFMRRLAAHGAEVLVSNDYLEVTRALDDFLRGGPGPPSAAHRVGDQVVWRDETCVVCGAHARRNGSTVVVVASAQGRCHAVDARRVAAAADAVSLPAQDVRRVLAWYRRRTRAKKRVDYLRKRARANGQDDALRVKLDAAQAAWRRAGAERPL